MIVISRNLSRAGRLVLPLAAVATLASCATTSTLPDPLAAGWNGVSVCERLHEDSELRVLRCTFEPGVGHERHYHAPHFGYTLNGGRVQITDASGVREVEISTGGTATSAGTDWHEIMNIGDTTIVYLVVEPK